MLCTGSVRGLLIAFVLASLASFMHSYFLNRLLPVPRKTAVLITGCSSGIGEAAALRLLKAGFLVFATVRKQEDADALKAKAGKSDMLHTLLLDVTDHARIKPTVEAVRQRLALDGRQLLGLILNAGGAEQSPLELLPLDVLRSQLELNVLGAVALTQAFLPLLRSASSPAHSSRVLFVSSITGRFVVPGLAGYSTSKFALEAVANAFRMELRRWHVDAVLIEPGQIATRFGQRVESSEQGVGGDRERGCECAVRRCEGPLLPPAVGRGPRGVGVRRHRARDCAHSGRRRGSWPVGQRFPPCLTWPCLRR